MADLDSETLEILDNNWLEDDFTFTPTNLFKPEALLSLADLDRDWLEDVNTKLDQYKLNLQIEKFNKIDLNQNGATTAQILPGYQTTWIPDKMTTWIPDKMAANQTRTTWLPDVNNEDRFSENPLENKRTLFINHFTSVHKN